MFFLFGVALAYIEAAVVVYLRAIFYPDGFTFPLSQGIPSQFRYYIFVEIARETATLVVLFTIAHLIGTNFLTRLAWFLTLFAVWDIFYYVWLKVLLNWPGSFMEWDVLFLIPTTWAGPILAPIIISLTMLLIAVTILYRQAKARPLSAGGFHLTAFLLISIVLIVLFCYAGQHITDPDYNNYFSWPIFLACETAALLIFIICCLKKTTIK